MDKKEKIKKLETAIKILKSEFIGLDSILDELKNAMYPWWVTPEINERPTVISLWGMTGTGKTSVIRRLVELLDLNGNTINIDCGECQDNDKHISEIITTALGDDDDNNNKSEKRNFIFVLDEFQYARTLDDSGCEDVKPSLRPLWSLIDNGIINLNETYNWSYSRFQDKLADIELLAGEFPNVMIDCGKITDPQDIEKVMSSVGYLLFISRVFEKEDDKDEIPPILIMDESNLKYIGKNLGTKGMDFIKRICTTKMTVSELCDELHNFDKDLMQTREIDCSTSLVFVIGNLDEAFKVSNDINPDFDADIFYDITKRITVTDIKNALKKRFRPEQIARLGNNLIKYPTLKGDDFRKIIKLEVNRILEKFKLIEPNLTINCSESFYKVLYSEGVYPTQGVRPLLTTISSMFSPYLSVAITEKNDNDTTLKIDAVGDVNASEIKIVLDFESHKVERIQKLQLGAIRNPITRKTRYCTGIHEAGHAVMMSYLTGVVPSDIVGVSVDGGGFCSTYDKDNEGEIPSRDSVDRDVMISLGGYYSELLFFKPGMCLMGSSSDIESAWESLSDAAYSIGYFEPIKFSSRETETNAEIPSGFSDKELYVNYYNGEVSIRQTMTISSAIERRYQELKNKTQEILSNEKELIRKVGIRLGETGSMTGEEFTGYVKKYGNKLTLEYMNQVKNSTSYDYYLNSLINDGKFNRS